MPFDPRRPPIPDHLRVPLGGRVRAEPEDFVVEEIPAYLPSGSGEHLMMLVEKRELTTPALVGRLAEALGIREREVGCAGYKDRHAVTRQWLTVPRVAVPEPERLVVKGARILEAGPHKNKLKLGHLHGNRFTITVRDPDPGALDLAARVLKDVARTGLPNGFGPQRFGTCRDNHLIAETLVFDQPELFFERIATAKPDEETPRIQQARAALGDARWKEALDILPREMALERHVAKAILKTGDRIHAIQTIPKRARDFLLSAWQSALFNRVLERRLASYDRLLPGDVAMKHENGACFLVEDLETEAPRAALLEISPTGPLPGPRMKCPVGEAGAIEDAELAAAGYLRERSSRLITKSAMQGVRRPLRVPVGEASAAAADDGALILRFTLPRGSFATSLLALFDLGEA